MKCLCPRCSEQPAPTYTEAWRRECEARYVLGMGKDQRRSYYACVGKFRGLPASRQLIADVEAEYAHQRERNQSGSVQRDARHR